MKKSLALAVLAASACLLQAQPRVQDRRASIRGGGDPSSGKCTIEVRVDGSADVEVSGDLGRLRTTGGQPANWTRMECTGPLPANMSDFRFRGIDGRGRQTLVRDPRNNRGVAVVHIEDSKGGSEGYTFDLEWSGGSGYGNYPGQGPGGYPGQVIPGRGNRISAERAIDLCRVEVRARAEREQGLRNVDITSIAVDDNPGRRDWVVGTFSERGFGARRGGGYRFACSVDFASGRLRDVEIHRQDGGPAPGGIGVGNDLTQAVRVCQDAVVTRMNRDGYQDVRFGNTNYDRGRRDYLIGTATGRRGQLVDNYDFNCTLDNGGRVRSIDVRRR